MNKVSKNYIYNVLYQILILLLPLVTTPYISRVLQADGIGTYSYTYSINQYFILFGCIGLNLYGQREIAFYQNKNYERTKTFYEILILRFITVLVSLVMYYFTLCRDGEFIYIYKLLSLNIVANMVDVLWFFQGIEEFKKILIRNTLVKILSVFAIFIFVKTVNDLWIYALCMSLSMLLGNLTMWMYIPKYLNKTSFSSLQITKHIKPTLVLFIPQVATSIYTVLDKTMIGILTSNVSEVAYYEQSQKIIKIAMAFVTSMGTVMMPRIANLYAEGKHNEIKRTLENSFTFVFMIGMPILIGIILVTRHFIGWFFGHGFEKVIPNMIIISPIILLIGLSNVIGTQFLLPTKRQTEYTISVITGSIANIILNLILITLFSSLGAAIATVIAELIITLVQIYFVRKDFNILSYIIKSKKYILGSLIMGFSMYIFGLNLETRISTTIIEIAIGIITYIGFLLIIKDKKLIDLLSVFVKK